MVPFSRWLYGRLLVLFSIKKAPCLIVGAFHFDYLDPFNFSGFKCTCGDINTLRFSVNHDTNSLYVGFPFTFTSIKCVGTFISCAGLSSSDNTFLCHSNPSYSNKYHMGRPKNLNHLFYLYKFIISLERLQSSIKKNRLTLVNKSVIV